MKNIKFLKIISLSFMLSGIGLYLGSCSNKKDEIYTNLNIMRVEISSEKQIQELEFFNKNIKELIIKEGVTHIPKKAFMNNLIEEITIPNSVQKIEDYAFEGNRITKIKIDVEKSNLKKIGKSAFGSISTNELKLNKSLEELSEASFKNSIINILDISSCDKLKLIPREAFYNSSIKTIKLNDNLEQIDEFAFMENGVQSLEIPKNLKVIKNGAFNSNEISNKFVFNNIENIEQGAFESNKIREIYINTNKIKNIGKDAFANQKEIDYIDIKLEESLNFNLDKNLYKPFGNYYLDESIVKQLLIMKAEDYLEIKENKILGFKKDVNIDEYFELTYNNSFKKTLSIPYSENINSIADSSFKGLEIDNIIINDNIKTIGKEAFKNNNITSLFLNLVDTEIDKGAFYDNPIEEINLNIKFKENYKNFINSDTKVNFLEN